MFFRFFLLISLLPIIILAHEYEKEAKKHYGYSYLAIGMQKTGYSQHFKSNDGEYNLNSTSSSPYYTTATLTRVNEKYGFEIYAASTLFASSSKEKLQSNMDSTEHTLDMTLTDVALTIHYKPISENHRITFAGRYTYEVLKRYNFTSSGTSLNLLNTNTSTVVENKIAALALDIGYLYMSKVETGIQGFNYRLGVSAGIPFFTATADTYNTAEIDLNSAWGYKINTNFYLAYTLFSGMELGAYMDFLYQKRHDDIQGENPDGNLVTAKESTKTLTNMGIMVSWSF